MGGSLSGPLDPGHSQGLQYTVQAGTSSNSSHPGPPPLLGPFPEQFATLAKEIENLKKKRAICLIRRPTGSKGFYSRMFAVSKRDGVGDLS